MENNTYSYVEIPKLDKRIQEQKVSIKDMMTQVRACQTAVAQLQNQFKDTSSLDMKVNRIESLLKVC
mgnify:CR=1 FL=1